MAKRGRPPTKFKFDDLPEALRFSIINMMAEYRIRDFDKAYSMAGMLLRRNSVEYRKSVQKEAERLYRSRHFSELNKARSTIEKKAYERGYYTGHKRGVNENQVWYFCKVCGKSIVIVPNSNSHNAVIQLMREHGWGHESCHKRRS